MSEDIFQVYEKLGVNETPMLRASDMSIHDACLFITAAYEEAYNEQELIYEIRRQPKDYGKYNYNEKNNSF